MLGLGNSISLSSAVSGFSPDSISDLEMWLKYETSITTDSGSVTAWADQTGNEHGLVQNLESERPALVGSVVRFDGTNHDMNIDTDISINANQDFTLITLIATQGSDPSNASIWGSNANNIFRFNDNQTFRTKIGGAGSSDFGEGSATIALTTYYTIMLVRSDGDTGNLKVYVGDAATYTTNGGVSWDDAETHTDTDAFSLNTVMGLSNRSQRLRADIKEMLVYTKALDQNERQDIIDYHNAIVAG